MKRNFMLQIFIAFILAIAAGILFGERIQVVQPLGDLFLRLIKFIIVPLILSTIVVGVIGAGNIKKLGRLGGKTLVYFLATSFIAIALGLFAGFVFQPGTGVEVAVQGEAVEAPETEGVIATLLNIIPTNPIEALTTGAVLQIIFFAIFLGLGISLV